MREPIEGRRGRGADSVWSRWGDWLLGRNMIIGVASLILLAISGFATLSGMLDFIIGIQSGPGAGDAVAGAKGALVIAIVIVLTLLMWIALRETIKPLRWTNRFLTLPLYLFLVLWSVGFGYGYWWSLIAGGPATKAGLQGQAEDVRDAAVEITARLAAVQSRLEGVLRVSARQMAVEERSGGSCGIASAPGRGPLWRARDQVRQSVDALSEDIRANWLNKIETDLSALNEQLATIGGEVTGATLAERQQQFEKASAQVRGQANEIATRSNALGASFAGEMRGLAGELMIAPGDSRFKCYDPQLSERLREAADDAARPARVKLRAAAFSEGAAGVANAVMSLWSRIGATVHSLFFTPDPAEIEDRQPLTGRDLIALLAAIGVDLGIFVLAVLNPPIAPPVRNDKFERNVAQVKLASPRVIRELAHAFENVIRLAPDADLTWIRKHFLVHDGQSFFVIPSLYRCDPGEEARKGLAINQFAGVLDEFDLIVPISDEQRRAYWDNDPRRMSITYVEDKLQDAEWAKQLRDEAAKGLREGREPGLFGKSRRALELAGWGADARHNPQVWRLVDDEGLTPLLDVLEEASGFVSASEAAPLASAPADPADPALGADTPPAQLEDKRGAKS
ncbi:MAG: hypothetical protein MRY63_11955 [Neomegalonema sp.]|nr:hypothetical protein [Neomegalonema sp.]